MLDLTLGITHDPVKDPILWNQDWERTIRNKERRSFCVRFPLDEAGKESMLSNHRTRVSTLLRLHNQLLHIVGETPEFAARWLATTALDRETHILNSLVGHCSTVQLRATDRIWCEQFTLPRLQRGNGQGLLDLLDDCLVESEQSTVKLLAEPEFEDLVGKRRCDFSESEKVQELYYDGLRTAFIREIRVD